MQQYTNPQVVRVPVLRVPVISGSRALGTGGAQSFQTPRYPEDWPDSALLVPLHPEDWRDLVLLGLEVPLGLAGLSPCSPPDTLEIGGTQTFQAPRFPVDWRCSVFSAPQVS